MYGDASRRYADTELKTRVLRVCVQVMATSPCVKRTLLMPRENTTRFMGRVARRERRQARARIRILRGCTLHALRSDAGILTCDDEYTRSFRMYRVAA